MNDELTASMTTCLAWPGARSATTTAAWTDSLAAASAGAGMGRPLRASTRRGP